MRDLLVITPSRARPHCMHRLADAVAATATAQTDLVFAVDDDDLPSIAAGAVLGLDTDRVRWVSGPRDSLIGWTNRIAGAQAGNYRALASLGDDHMPRTPGWDTALLDAIDRMGGTGIAYGNDLLQGANLPTAPVVSSDIVAALGWMCLPGVAHYCADNAWKDLAEGAGCLAYLPGVVIEHLHPAAGKAPLDATYTDANLGIPNHPDSAVYEQWRTERMAADVATIRALRDAR